jgi:hypothetical protein
MSLINDALKRAKQAQKRPSPPPAGVPLRPAESVRSGNAPRPLLMPILAAALLVFVGGVLIVVALTRGFGIKPGEPVASKSAVVSPTDNPGTSATLPRMADVSPATRIATPVIAQQPVPTNLPSTAAVAAPVVTQSVLPVESSNAVTVVQVPPAPQLPRLQGIVFNPARPTAFLNGKSVVAGGRVGEYTVIAITKQTVTVERSGQTNVLTMEE